MEINRNNPNGPVRKLYRSADDKVIAGLCGGLAEYMRCDSNIVRLAAVLLFFFAGLSLWVYLIAWIIIPLGPARGDSGRTCGDNGRQ